MPSTARPRDAPATPPPPANPHHSLKHSGAGALSGAITSFVTCPLDVVKTRLQVQVHGKQQGGVPKYNGTLGTIRTLYVEEGAYAFYRGLTPIMLALVPTWSLYFPAYRMLKEETARWLGASVHDARVQGAAAVGAGVITSAVTNPLWVVKTRLQAQFRPRPSTHQPTHVYAPRYRHTGHAFVKIAREEGLRGFYKGLGASLIGVAHVAVQLPLYERLRMEMTTRFCAEGQPLSPAQIMVAAAVSKATASMVAYPHEVVRSRLQHDHTVHWRIVHLVHRMISQEGVRSFYRGMGTNLLRVVPNGVITFMSFEMFLRLLHDDF